MSTWQDISRVASENVDLIKMNWNPGQIYSLFFTKLREIAYDRKQFPEKNDLTKNSNNLKMNMKFWTKIENHISRQIRIQ